MNNNQNNGSTIILLLIIMMISSSISSIGAVLGFNILSYVKPSSNVKSYIRTQDDRLTQLGNEVGIDGNALKDEIVNETKRACLVPMGADGKCPEGMQRMSNGCCEFIDPRAQTSLGMLADMAPDLAIGIIGGVLAEYVILAGVNTGTYLLRGTNTMGAKLGAGAGAKAGTGAGARAGAGVGAKAGARAGANVGAKMGASAGAKIATQFGTRLAWATACGPICIAVTVATAVFTIALDLTDPFGYDNFTANETIRRKRNAVDVMLQKSMIESKQSYPMTFPLTVAFPDFNKELEEKIFIEFLPDALELMPKDLMIQFFTSMLKGEPSTDKDVLDAFGVAMDTALANIAKRDDIMYEFYAGKGKKSEIERVPFMSTKTRIGVTLSKKGVDKYNERMKDKHLLYSNPHRSPPKDKPDDYTPFVAMYTDTYREINVSNPGSENNPNVIEKKIERPICLAMPYGMLIADCEYGFRSTKHSQRLNPATYGVKFNYARGDCDFTNDYCKRLGLDFKGNECKLRPGQEVAELIFGKTITRVYVEDWDNRIEAWKSGDPASITLATVSLLAPVIAPWIAKGIAAIKDTYGRGAGTPMVCGPDKERKGELCYPKCRTGPGGEKLYNSRALECEGTCPKGSTNTGLTCLQSIHSYIPSNKSSNPFNAGFYQRADCRALSKNEVNSDLGKALAAAGKPLKYKFRGTTCNQPCYPGFTFRSGAAGSAFCDKPRNRYSRAGKAKVPDKCPEGKVRDASLCYKPCKPGYRGNGPTCKKSEESKQKNPYKV